MSEHERGYQSGFGNELATEALEGALPVGRNSPQRAPYGLYADQLSGTAFTAPRAENRRSWLYRIRPAAMHEPFTRLDDRRIVSEFESVETPPNQLRWNPLPLPEMPTDFVEGLVTVCGNGDVAAGSGSAVSSRRGFSEGRVRAEIAGAGRDAASPKPRARSATRAIAAETRRMRAEVMRASSA